MVFSNELLKGSPTQARNKVDTCQYHLAGVGDSRVIKCNRRSKCYQVGDRMSLLAFYSIIYLERSQN